MHWKQFFDSKYDLSMRRNSGFFTESIQKFCKPEQALAQGIEHDFQVQF